MPRKSRRRALPRPLLCPNHAALGPGERAPHLDELVGAVERLAAAFSASPLLSQRLTAAQRRTLRGRWAAHLPQLALRLATVLEREPEALGPLRLSGADLRAQEDEVRRLFALKAVLDVLSDRVADALLEGRGALCSDVQRTLEAIATLTDGPLAQPEVALRLRTAAEPARALLGRRQQAIRARRRQLKELRRGAEPPALGAGPEPGDGPAGAAGPGSQGGRSGAR